MNVKLCPMAADWMGRGLVQDYRYLLVDLGCTILLDLIQVQKRFGFRKSKLYFVHICFSVKKGCTVITMIVCMSITVF